MISFAGKVPAGLPPLSLSFPTDQKELVDMIEELGGGVVLVPLVAILGNVAIAKAFGTFITNRVVWK